MKQTVSLNTGILYGDAHLLSQLLRGQRYKTHMFETKLGYFPDPSQNKIKMGTWDVCQSFWVYLFIFLIWEMWGRRRKKRGKRMYDNYCMILPQNTNHRKEWFLPSHKVKGKKGKQHNISFIGWINSGEPIYCSTTEVTYLCCIVIVFYKNRCYSVVSYTGAHKWKYQQ